MYTGEVIVPGFPSALSGIPDSVSGEWDCPDVVSGA